MGGGRADVSSVPDGQLFRDALSGPPVAIEYSVSQVLAAAFPGKAMIETDTMGMFDVESYARAGHCTIARRPSPRPQVLTYWTGLDVPAVPGPHFGPGGLLMGMAPGDDVEAGQPREETLDRITHAWVEVRWQDAALDMVMMAWGDPNRRVHYWILADRDEIARGFLAAVCRWAMELRGEMLVFENGGWHKDEHLFRAIQSATFGALILRGQLKEDIWEDAHRFFAAQTTYDEYGIPWKRGLLFVGPPGNGKTLTVKALVNSLPVPCLYVKSFRAPHGVDEISMRQVFDRARRMAPCVLVLEDLDAQLTPQNRSFFLNELDGFALNRGILTLATTNHPERLDPSILDRPSRFDRKYPFDLPGQPERQAYLALWNTSLKPALRLSDAGVAAIAEQTEGFSFAYLKELGLSSMMGWIAAPAERAMDEIMATQVVMLREQMVSAPPDLNPDATQMQQMPPMFGHVMTSHVRFGPEMPGMPGR
jgi:hypothetical protein